MFFQFTGFGELGELRCGELEESANHPVHEPRRHILAMLKEPEDVARPGERRPGDQEVPGSVPERQAENQYDSSSRT